MLDDYLFDPPHKFAFVLLPDFSLLSLSSAIEPLRIANSIAHRELYKSLLYSFDGSSCPSSSGVTIATCGCVDDIPSDFMIILCGGLDCKNLVTPSLLNWLKKAARFYPVMGGLCTATRILAQAGLLEGYKCSIHWYNIFSMREEFPHIEVTDNLFQIDRNRITCSGGTAPLDMMLELIDYFHGSKLALEVADQTIHNLMGTRQTRFSLPAKLGTRNPKLLQVIDLMQKNIDNPIAPSKLALEANISTRQLERLFHKYLGISPKRYYMILRLNKSRQLLLHTNLQIADISLACGFSSTAHFVKCYRLFYGSTPYQECDIRLLSSEVPFYLKGDGNRKNILGKSFTGLSDIKLHDRRKN